MCYINSIVSITKQEHLTRNAYAVTIAFKEFLEMTMYICMCNGVTDDELKESIAQGNNTLDKIADELNVTNVCGSCKPVVLDFLNKEKPV